MWTFETGRGGLTRDHHRPASESRPRTVLVRCFMGFHLSSWFRDGPLSISCQNRRQSKDHLENTAGEGSRSRPGVESVDSKSLSSDVIVQLLALPAPCTSQFQQTQNPPLHAPAATVPASAACTTVLHFMPPFQDGGTNVWWRQGSRSYHMVGSLFTLSP